MVGSKGHEDSIPRNPVSSATEKCEQSALKEAERTKGPASESRMGLVFIVAVVAVVVVQG